MQEKFDKLLHLGLDPPPARHALLPREHRDIAAGQCKSIQGEEGGGRRNVDLVLRRTRARVACCVLRPDGETLSKESSRADADTDTDEEEATPGAYAASRARLAREDAGDGRRPSVADLLASVLSLSVRVGRGCAGRFFLPCLSVA